MMNENIPNNQINDQMFIDSLKTGTQGGASISHLKRNNPPSMQHPNNQQVPTMYPEQQNPNQQHPSMYHHNPGMHPQQQQQQYPNMFPQHQNQQPMQQVPQQHQTQESEKEPRSDKDNMSTIKHFANDINNKLKESVISDTETRKTATDTTDTESSIDTEHDLRIRKTKKREGKILENIKEVILITLVYTILSQDFMKRTIGQYIPQTTTGTISGYMIYGAIHAFLYLLFKMILKIS